MAARELPDDIKRRLTKAQERAIQLSDSLSAWREELWKWHDLSLKLNLGLPSLDYKIRTFTTTDLYRRALLVPSVARVVGPDDKLPVLRAFELPAIVLTLDAPDSEIRARFEAALDEARKRFPLAFEKPGRRGLDRALPWSETFNKWRNHDILPWAEYISWRSGFGASGHKLHPDVRFAEWRESNRSTVPETKKALQEAIHSLPRLHRILWHAANDLDEAAEATARNWAAEFAAEEQEKGSEKDG